MNTERELTPSNTETDQEILDAIYSLADGNEEKANRIWDNPSKTELLAIWKTVTENGLLPAEDFCYGTSGSRWADDINADSLIIDDTASNDVGNDVGRDMTPMQTMTDMLSQCYEIMGVNNQNFKKK